MERGKISSFKVAQLSRWHDLKCLSLIHFSVVNMLRQVANFLGMSSPRRLRIKRVGIRPHLPVHGSQAAGPPPGGRGCLSLAREVAGSGQR